MHSHLWLGEGSALRASGHQVFLAVPLGQTHVILNQGCRAHAAFWGRWAQPLSPFCSENSMWVPYRLGPMAADGIKSLPRRRTFRVIPKQGRRLSLESVLSKGPPELPLRLLWQVLLLSWQVPQCPGSQISYLSVLLKFWVPAVWVLRFLSRPVPWFLRGSGCDPVSP